MAVDLGFEYDLARFIDFRDVAECDRVRRIPRTELTQHANPDFRIVLTNDVTEFYRSFAADLNMAVLYISHDLSTMRHICSSIAVMYLGRIIEMGPADAILDAPHHPYAQALVASVPVMGGRTKRQRTRLVGAVPNAADIPTGCRFHPRCPKAMARCREKDPQLRAMPDGRLVACHLYDQSNVRSEAVA